MLQDAGYRLRLWISFKAVLLECLSLRTQAPSGTEIKPDLQRIEFTAVMEYKGAEHSAGSNHHRKMQENEITNRYCEGEGGGEQKKRN